MSYFEDIGKTLATRSLFFTSTTSLRSLDDLPPPERQAIATACVSRQREFATGRFCAHRLLSDMGVTCEEIGQGNNNEPLWPEGICGSIAHTAGACCVIAALTTQYKSVGIDIEKASRPISEPARRMFLNNDEMQCLSAKAGLFKNVHLTVFSIKETIYKMLFPLTKKVIPFSAVSVQPLTDEGSFACRVNIDLSETISAGMVLNGWMFHDQTWILTAAALR